MMDVKLKCACGEVEGIATDASSASGNRVVCCCDDCQVFAEHLQGGSVILDDFGGTEIFQTSQAQVKITRGGQFLRCVRLTPKGLTRWYVECCNTPVGNTLSGGMPFVGLIHNFMSIDGDRDATLGPVRAYVQTKHARGVPTYPHRAEKFPIGITLRLMRKMLVWKLAGKSKPSAFYDAAGRPVVKPVILDSSTV